MIETTMVDRALLRRAAEQLKPGYDRENGGFGSAPKFPMPHDLLFLMEYARREGDREAQAMVEHTLTRMARGGIFDQIGGGFFRYSTDERWFAPRFEKTLCDNALLAYTYLEAYARTGKRFYQETARRTLDYVLRELRLPDGGFACGQDAESGGGEGQYYLLTWNDVCGVLGEEEGARFCAWFGIDAHGECVPNLLFTPEYGQTWRNFAQQCEKLSDFRRGGSLHRDGKVLTSWNALMIAALTKAYRVLGEQKYLDAAQTAWLFLKTRLTRPDGRLYLCWWDGEAAVDGQLDDYAFTCWALLELYAADFSISCLREAVELAQWMAELFWDGEHGGFFRTPRGGERLIARQKESYDGATPSGNAVAALALERLGRLTGDPETRALAARQMDWLAEEAWEYPSARCFALLAMMEELYPSRELVCVSAGGISKWLAVVGEEYGITALMKTAENRHALERVAPYTAAYPIPTEGERMYFCRGGTCAAELDSLAQLRRQIAEEKVPV